MRLILKLAVVAMALLTISSAIIHPYGTVKDTRSGAPLFTGAEADSDVTRIFERSCGNCHSDRTEWPWYSYIAPLSWMIENDVHSGRSHMNLSHWDAYSEERKVELLTKMGVEVRNRRMPLPKIHSPRSGQGKIGAFAPPLAKYTHEPTFEKGPRFIRDPT